MKKTKRLTALITALALTISLSACGENNNPPEESTEESTTPAAEVTSATTTTSPKVTTTTTTTLPPLPVMSEYEEMHTTNPDMIGWLNIPIYDHDPDPETQRDVDYPVVQGEDNKYYLTHDFEGNESTNGAMFMDFKCEFPDTRKRPANTIIYGHNMRTGHTLAKLVAYYPYYFKHKTIPTLAQYEFAPTVTFNTIWQEGTYKVFAGMFVNTEEKHGEVFKYYKQRTITSKKQFYTYIAKILDRSTFYNPDVDLKYGDELLTLSTCYYPMDSVVGEHVDTRFVVFARRVRDGESPEVDTSKAGINPSPLYFDQYYKTYGGKWAGRKWDQTWTDLSGVEHEPIKVEGFAEYLEKHPDCDAAEPAHD